VSAVYAPLGITDFEKAGAGFPEILPVLKELVDNLNGNKIFALLHEVQKNKVGILMAVHEQVQMDKILVSLPGAKQLPAVLGDLKLVECSFLDKTLEEAEEAFGQAVEKASA